MSLPSRVIVCKIGRLGEIRKILDRTNGQQQGSGTGTGDEGGGKRCKRIRQGLETPNRKMVYPGYNKGEEGESLLKQLLRRGPGGGQNEVRSETQAGILNACRRIRQRGNLKRSPFQIVNSTGGLLISSDLRSAIMSLGVGDTVRGCKSSA